MSFSQQQITNPVTKYIEWKSSKKAFQYYDKEKGEGEIVDVKLPIKFIVLDELTTIKGFDTELECPIFSNEVKFTTKEPLHVRSKKGGEIASGIYKDIKDTLKSAGGKYTRVVYANLEGEIVKLLLSGSALSYLEDMKKMNTSDSVITVKTTIEGKKGSNKYNIPVFEYAGPIEANSKLYTDCCEMDDKIQTFFKDRTAKANEFAKEEAAKDAADEAIEEGIVEGRESFAVKPTTAEKIFKVNEKTEKMAKDCEVKPEDLPF